MYSFLWKALCLARKRLHWLETIVFADDPFLCSLRLHNSLWMPEVPQKRWNRSVLQAVEHVMHISHTWIKQKNIDSYTHTRRLPFFVTTKIPVFSRLLIPKYVRLESHTDYIKSTSDIWIWLCTGFKYSFKNDFTDLRQYRCINQKFKC